MSFYSAFATYYEAIFPFSERCMLFCDAVCPPRAWCWTWVAGRGTTPDSSRRMARGFGVDLDAAMIAYAQEHYPQARFSA
jgi:hypothetical protein